MQDPLTSLDAAELAALEARGLDVNVLRSLSARLASGELDDRVVGHVEPLPPHLARELPGPGAERERLRQRGLGALRDGQVALVVLAGGMATRMGGCVKALVEVQPGRTFLDVRLEDRRRLAHTAGREPPLWLMTSAATHAALADALGDALDGDELALFPQGVSLRLRPDGGLFRDAAGRVSEYAPGHGDLPDALRRSGLLQRFVARGGRTLMLANLDNLGATLDPLLIGWHLEHEGPLTCELCDREPGDRGGVPALVEGRPVVLEEQRLPAGFPMERSSLFNTNTFLVQAAALLELRATWTWCSARKEVGGEPVVQAERLLGELTSFLPTRFVRVPRHGEASRFLPVKSFADLEARRGELEASLRARGIV